MANELEATIKALQGSLTDLGVKKAVANIDGWMTTLEKADFRGAKTIHENLGKLKRELETEKPDGAAIRATMRTLGEETMRAASGVEGAQGDQIKQLADLLTKAGGTSGK